MLILYNVISVIGLFLYLPVLLAKKGPERRLSFIKERLGMAGYEKTDLWIHAVSVGETMASIPFLKQIKKEFPDKKILLSTTTYTGQNIARSNFPEADRIMYIPLDSYPCIKRAVAFLRPDIFISVETELWPALFQNLKHVGSRIIIVNGRISNNSYQGYRKIQYFMKNVLSVVDFFYMQGRSDAERIIALGVDSRKVGIMGNFKFDIDFKDSSPPKWLSGLRGKILLAASTHRGEEEILLDAFTAIKNRIPALKLILAPRHPERFNETAELIGKRGFPCIKRSSINGTEHPLFDSADIILLDTIGELSRVFSRADVAFIGGSLVPLGGHNIMEPAYWSKPIIFGPHMDNFPIAREFLEKSAAIEVRDSEEIALKVVELLTVKEHAADMGQNARAIVDENTGAVRRAVELVRGYFGTL